jgi:nicotinamidase-related amidase
VIAGLSRTRAALLVIDIQDRLVPSMPEATLVAVLRNTRILIEAAAQLGVPIVVSQQYPRGLGNTTKAIEDALATVKQPVHRFDKVEFSAPASPAFGQLAPALGRDQWILCGMETHVCVYQSARDLVARGWSVHVCADAVCSRTPLNWELGLRLVERAGAIVTSTEVCVFDLLGRAGSDEFRALSKAIK